MSATQVLEHVREYIETVGTRPMALLADGRRHEFVASDLLISDQGLSIDDLMLVAADRIQGTLHETTDAIVVQIDPGDAERRLMERLGSTCDYVEMTILHSGSSCPLPDRIRTMNRHPMDDGPILVWIDGTPRLHCTETDHVEWRADRLGIAEWILRGDDDAFVLRRDDIVACSDDPVSGRDILLADGTFVHIEDDRDLVDLRSAISDVLTSRPDGHDQMTIFDNMHDTNGRRK